MRVFATAMVLSTATISASAFAADPKTVAEDTEQKEEKKEAKKICKRISDMGSRRTTRKCLTREQWLEFNRGN